LVIDCKHVWEHISGYLEDTLTTAERAMVQGHLEHCEVCSAILDSTRNILILVVDERVFELPVGFSERLHARLEEALRAGVRPQSSSCPVEDALIRCSPALRIESSSKG
jgi:predicted anti-sigma-YlaC factor YlaD